MAKFEQKLRNVITHFCETPKSFADLMGVSPQVVSNWMARGIKNVDTLQEIFIKLPDLNPSYFFDEEAEMLRSAKVSADGEAEKLRMENQMLRDEIIQLHIQLAQLRVKPQKMAAG